MIYFNFNIDNPWSTRWKTIWCKSGVLPNSRAWEFNGYRTHHIIDIDFRFTQRCDHAGIQFILGLFGYSVEFHIYKTLHWDYKNNCWEL